MTANWQSLSAQAEVKILGGTSLPVGIVRWSLPVSTALISVGEEACCTFLAGGVIASAPMVSEDESIYLEVVTNSVTETSVG